jgi:type 1 glutamine amidotransferase
VARAPSSPRHESCHAPPLTALALAGLTVVVLAAPAGIRPADKTIRVILIDGQNNHPWRATTPLLKQLLEETGRFRVDVSSNLQPHDKPGDVKETVPFPPDLAQHDVLLSNYNGPAWPAQFRQDLDELLKAGQIALVIIHAANNAFSNRGAYNAMIGLGWRNSTFGERLVVDEQGREKRVPRGKGPKVGGTGTKYAFKLTIRDGEHPITKGMPREWMHAADELYHGLRGPVQNVHLLATAYSDKDKGGPSSSGEHEPMIWTVSYGKGRVFHTPLGHDPDGMRCVGFIATVQSGTEWAATGQVTLPLPANFPAAEKTSSVKVK